MIWGYTESPHCTSCLTLRALDNAKEYISNFLIYCVMNLEKIHEVYHSHVAKSGLFPHSGNNLPSAAGLNGLSSGQFVPLA